MSNKRIASHACGVINIDTGFPITSITYIAKGLEEASLNKIKDFLKSTNAEYVDDYINQLNNIAEYFGTQKFIKDQLLQ